MKKLNEVIYNKFILQAEEAKEQDMTKLAQAILGSLTASPENEKINYSINDLNHDIYMGLWKLATCVLKYHDLESADVEKVNEAIEILANKFITEVENSLQIPEGTVGPLEEKLLGENK